LRCAYPACDREGIISLPVFSPREARALGGAQDAAPRQDGVPKQDAARARGEVLRPGEVPDEALQPDGARRRDAGPPLAASPGPDAVLPLGEAPPMGGLPHPLAAILPAWLRGPGPERDAARNWMVHRRLGEA
jgi:hypothetical protein